MPTYTYTTFNDPLVTITFNPDGINDAGQIVGYYTDSSRNINGFLYSGGKYTTLDVPFTATSNTVLSGIKDKGQIVGYYADSSGVHHGFVYSGGGYTTIDDPLAVGSVGTNAGIIGTAAASSTASYTAAANTPR